MDDLEERRKENEHQEKGPAKEEDSKDSLDLKPKIQNRLKKIKKKKIESESESEDSLDNYIEKKEY